MANFLIFVDTNILLDFYRVRGRDAGLSILSHIDDNLDRFVTGSQVEMEFKKHRQRVILESHGVFKADWGGLQLPAFLAESKQSRALTKSRKQVQSLSATLKSRMTRVLQNPTTQDAVYRTAQRLFRSPSPWNLGRNNKRRYAIRRLAWKRFMLGYPPRKSNDTSIGDAINWEWVIECARESGCNVVIVSRDSDYGEPFEKQPVINDWLLQEFRERVSRRRKLILTDRLSAALKTAEITVTRQEVENEEQFLKEAVRTPNLQTGSLFASEAFQRALGIDKLANRAGDTGPAVAALWKLVQASPFRAERDEPEDAS